MLTFIKNSLRYRSFQKSYAQADHQHIVHLTDDWDEIRDKLDWTGYIEHRAHANQLRVPWHIRMNESAREDPKLFIQLAGSRLQSCG
jgi:hypothetical protein